MKFGLEYQEALTREEYPSQWIDSAISYKKLKKCIKRVKEELLSLGLDHETLEALWQHVGADSFSNSTGADVERMMQYKFTNDEGVRFIPKLTIALDPRDGSPMDAWLSPETRHVLQRVGTHRQRKLSRVPSHRSEETARENTDDSNESPTASQRSEPSSASPIRGSSTLQVPGQPDDQVHETDHEAVEEIETVEIPLTSDSEFFQILRQELKSLEKLQNQERKEIETSIESLSHDLQVVKSSKSRAARQELNIWREIFRLYIESEIFMSAHETDAGVRSADKAAKQLDFFLKQISGVNTNPRKPKSKEAHIALDRFLSINTTLLQLLKFQELNRRALTKIMKKFDKQTALHAVSTASPQQMIKTLSLNPNTKIVSPHELARSTAFTISQNLLSLIPQLDDYLCPICSYISYKPVRLRCGHIFCIRCMIRMQRDDKDECPLCRQHVVLDAHEGNLDYELKKFLKKEFPDEVGEKKRENELAAGKELFGEGYTGTHKCVVM